MIEKKYLDNKFDLFLNILEKDIKDNPEKCQPLDYDLICFIKSLFINEVIDIEEPIIGQD